MAMKNAWILLLSVVALIKPSLAWSRSARFDALEERIVRVLESGSRPLVVFDLDDTLFDSRFRMKKIFEEFADDPTIQERFADVLPRLKGLTTREIQYSAKETLIALGLTDPAILEAMDTFFRARFFSNEYLKYDGLIPGAAALTRRFAHAGARAVYLTGRDRPRMAEGTVGQLTRFGLPFGTAGILFMKPQADMVDRDYKATALESIAKLGTVVGAFENEPTNANLLQERFSDAEVFLLEKIESGKPVRLDPRIKRIRGYERGAARRAL
jgi:hypothetical protein